MASGEKIAYDNAFDKLWPLFGFLLLAQRGLAQFVVLRLLHQADKVDLTGLAGLKGDARVDHQKILGLRLIIELTPADMF